jgi:hypothetical protein
MIEEKHPLIFIPDQFQGVSGHVKGPGTSFPGSIPKNENPG